MAKNNSYSILYPYLLEIMFVIPYHLTVSFWLFLSWCITGVSSYCLLWKKNS